MTDDPNDHARSGTLIEKVHATLARIDETEPIVHAWETLNPEGALHAPFELSRYGNADRNALSGVTLGVKDVIDVAGYATKAGSRARDDATPATVDATVVARLRRAGCVILGKTKTTEFAYTDPTDTANPANLAHTPGGSSSGSAAAIAAGHAELTLGTQTVGSVCRPAAYCGVAAFKPTTGSMPSSGVTPFARTFDTVGFFAKNMRIAVAAYRCCADMDYHSHAPSRSPASAARPLDGIRIGMLEDDFYLANDAMTEALEMVKALLIDGGAHVSGLTTRCDFQDMRERQRTMIFYESARSHSDLMARPDLLGPNWRTAMETGASISDASYIDARDRLADSKNKLAAAWAGQDFLLLPPARTPAPEGLHSTGDAGLIVPWTIAGSPLAVLPVGHSDKGLPTAVMIAGKPWADQSTGRLGIAIEDAIRRQAR